MAKNPAPKGTPSQNSVPQQDRFYHEFDSNVDRLSTPRPRSQASSNYPGPFPLPKLRTPDEMNAAGGAFMWLSNTNGKK
jgi:hypothetical protein